jgi:predicted RNase H-like HicB family nuclease
MAQPATTVDISNLVKNTVIMTASMVNQVTIQTNGEFIFPPHDYVVMVNNFQISLAKRIMPLKTLEEVEEAIKLYVTALLEAQNIKPKKDGDNNAAPVDKELDDYLTGEREGSDF